MMFALTDDHLSATLNAQLMTDEEFLRFCQDHLDLAFEMTADGELIVMATSSSLSGARHMGLGAQFYVWARQDAQGVACDSSTGYVLPSGARRSPDVSWTLKHRLAALDPVANAIFWHVCPDFVMELRSPSDRLKTLRAKMREYIANGAQLGWLIDPTDQSVTIYRPNAEPETRISIDSVTGEGPISTFTLDLTCIWTPFSL